MYLTFIFNNTLATLKKKPPPLYTHTNTERVQIGHQRQVVSKVLLLGRAAGSSFWHIWAMQLFTKVTFNRREGQWPKGSSLTLQIHYDNLINDKALMSRAISVLSWQRLTSHQTSGKLSVDTGVLLNPRPAVKKAGRFPTHRCYKCWAGVFSLY